MIRFLAGDRPALLWWRLLCVLAVLNVCLWLIAWQFGAPGFYSAAQLGLSGVYVFVCAYRSLLPRVDLERFVVVDSRYSSIFLGRCAATLAEICFGIQLGLLVHQLGAHAGLPWVQSAAWAIPVFPFAAQFFCWHSVLTLNHITQAVESLLWAVGFSLMAGLLTVVALVTNGVAQMFAAAGIVVSAVFVTYVLGVDVPLYVRRFKFNRMTGDEYLSIAQGARDAMERRVPSHNWEHWKEDAAWLTPYFSAGVWFSVALVFVPGV
jgi:hypothetical protein